MFLFSCKGDPEGTSEYSGSCPQIGAAIDDLYCLRQASGPESPHRYSLGWEGYCWDSSHWQDPT